ncbi:Similar to hypothetical protein AN9388.2 [Aspergillus nidulans FGSC A4]; acc. no. XP_682657 [Pyronema omphalodes CBS 100304]|uniref:Tyrosinase copper-binding domain-containing protein n=1 Tax=Pyronema omphalodes (strain CBS 100304) TaxID=1076935 RepID=U4LB04_PYROM|nr:Similar to hypothetical protein AN9388.2 [Aspergillus nidulans FGSC A4]; acc. no. XP_682657 [Pyronema omphalodes CBS 100304]
MLSQIILTILSLGSLASSAPQVHPRPIQEPPRLRKEWRLLNIIERQHYISAIQCLHSKPSIYQDLVSSSGSLFEDFSVIHKLQAPYIHGESQFLPWHRAFLWTFETTLRNECNYTGAQPYWDYGHDIDIVKTSGRDFYSSEIFDPVTGFGGDGEMMKNNDYPRRPPNMPLGIGGGCVMKGPFSKDKFKLQIAKGDKLGPADPRCLTRMFNPKVAKDWCGHEVEEAMKRTKSYKEFYQNMQGNSLDYNQSWGLHVCGHFSVTNVDIFIRTTDPLFFLHHTNLDRIWWEWQKRDPKKRTKEIDGKLKPLPSYFPDGDYGNFPDEKAEITLDWMVDIGRFGGKVKVADLMDITKSPVVNYEYSNTFAGWDDIRGTEKFKKEVNRLTALWEKWRSAGWSHDM